MRVFVALDLDDGLRNVLTALADDLRNSPRPPRDARWVRPESFHVTLRFVGEADEERVAALARGLPTLAPEAAIAVTAHALEGFPTKRAARVLVVSLAGTATVDRIAADVEALAVGTGCAPETRGFHAHVTLARLRAKADVSRLDVGTRLPASGFVTALTLYASRTERDGPRYEPIERVVLPIR